MMNHFDEVFWRLSGEYGEDHIGSYSDISCF